MATSYVHSPSFYWQSRKLRALQLASACCFDRSQTGILALQAPL